MKIGDTAINLINFDSANLQNRENLISRAEACKILTVSERTAAPEHKPTSDDSGGFGGYETWR